MTTYTITYCDWDGDAGFLVKYSDGREYGFAHINGKWDGDLASEASGKAKFVTEAAWHWMWPGLTLPPLPHEMPAEPIPTRRDGDPEVTSMLAQAAISTGRKFGHPPMIRHGIEVLRSLPPGTPGWLPPIDPEEPADRVARYLEEAIRLKPNDAEAFYDRGNAYFDKGLFDSAIQDFDEAIRLKPGAAKVLCGRGDAYAGKGEFDRAIEDFDEVIRLDPDYVVAYSNRGNAYADKGQFGRAMQDFDEALRIDEGNVLAFLSRGNLLADMGQFARAPRDYDEAISWDPSCAKAFYNRGLALRATGQRERAAADFAEANKLDPSLPSPRE